MTTNNKYFNTGPDSLFFEEILDEFEDDLDEFDDDYDREQLNSDTHDLMIKILHDANQVLGQQETLPLMEALCTLGMVDEEFEKALVRADGNQAAKMIETLCLQRFKALGYTPQSELEKQFWIESLQLILFQLGLDYDLMNYPSETDWQTFISTVYLGEYLDSENDALFYEPENMQVLEKVKKRITKSSIKTRITRSLKFFKQIIAGNDYLLEVLDRWGPESAVARKCYQEMITEYALINTCTSLLEQAAGEIAALAPSRRRDFVSKAIDQLNKKQDPIVNQVMDDCIRVLDRLSTLVDGKLVNRGLSDDGFGDEKDGYDDLDEEKYFRKP